MKRVGTWLDKYVSGQLNKTETSSYIGPANHYFDTV